VTALNLVLLPRHGGSTVVEVYTHNPKFEGSNPADDGKRKTCLTGSTDNKLTRFKTLHLLLFLLLALLSNVQILKIKMTLRQKEMI
jgi:hypothetical protein